MTRRSIRSYIHVSIQFTTLFYIILSGSLLIENYLIAIEFTGIVLGVWAVIVMRHSYLTIFPEPNSTFNLVKKGPYKIIRHPMYLALFLVIIPLIIDNPTNYRIIAGILFAINQIIKLLYEEKLIISKVEGYSKYMHKTWRILPLIF
jgi:protein-S-isoprenylcysteine O-methyltransferase Ste14